MPVVYNSFARVPPRLALRVKSLEQNRRSVATCAKCADIAVNSLVLPAAISSALAFLHLALGAKARFLDRGPQQGMKWPCKFAGLQWL